MKEKYILRDFHPLVLFYALGVGMAFISTGLFVRLIWLWSENGYAPAMTSLAFVFTATTAFNSVFFAMWFDMEANKHLR